MEFDTVARRRWSLWSLVILGLIALAEPASAMPAFARKYRTSCTTCHVVFPRLNPFGEAFRRNGYRFPDGGDAEAVKEEPIALGNEAQKELWPESVYPGELPRSLPLSLLVDGTAGVVRTRGDAAMAAHQHMPEETSSEEGMAGMDMGGASEPLKTTPVLATLGGHVGLRSAGTLGDLASFLASVDIGGHEPIGVERAALTLLPFGPTALHVKLGRFEPALHGVSLHRGLLGHQLELTTRAVPGHSFAPEPSRTGGELSGVVLGRGAWAMGVVETTRPTTAAAKDAYARAEWKLGGMRLDGVGQKPSAAAWRERSLSFGASAYYGFGARTDEMIGTVVNDRFLRVGVDLHAIFDDLLVDLVGARQMHTQPGVPGTMGGNDASMDLAFAELSYVVTPVFFPTVRAELARLPDEPWDRLGWTTLAGVHALLRPNLTLRCEAAFGAEPGDKTGLQHVSLAFAAAF